MLLLLWGILAILFNAHLFSGWKLNGNRKNSEFVEKLSIKLSSLKLSGQKKLLHKKTSPCGSPHLLV
ncbi:DUF3899 domain-containing protein [Pediococcus pentosaceus]